MARIEKLHWERDLCNTYVIGEEGEGCFVVDPGDNRNGRLDAYIARHHSKCFGFLVTHGHFDHISGLSTIKTEAPVYIMADDVRCLTDPKYNLVPGLTFDSVDPTIISDGDKLDLGPYQVKVIATPFHTEGSCCFYLAKEKALFSGDTLFHLSVGRCDLPGGDEDEMASSLSKLMKLPSDTKVYPGHDEGTRLEEEFANNPYFLSLRHR